MTTGLMPWSAQRAALETPVVSGAVALALLRVLLLPILLVGERLVVAPHRPQRPVRADPRRGRGLRAGTAHRARETDAAPHPRPGIRVDGRAVHRSGADLRVGLHVGWTVLPGPGGLLRAAARRDVPAAARADGGLVGGRRRRLRHGVAPARPSTTPTPPARCSSPGSIWPGRAPPRSRSPGCWPLGLSASRVWPTNDRASCVRPWSRRAVRGVQTRRRPARSTLQTLLVAGQELQAARRSSPDALDRAGDALGRRSLSCAPRSPSCIPTCSTTPASQPRCRTSRSVGRTAPGSP